MAGRACLVNNPAPEKDAGSIHNRHHAPPCTHKPTLAGDLHHTNTREPPLIGLLNFLRDHDHLLEMFLENRDPYATQPLPQWVVEAVRPHLGRQDRIRALASGRIVGANRGVWVVTDRELLVVESGIKPRVRSLPLNSVELCSNLKGKYGQTLRVEGMGQRHSLIGAALSTAAITQDAIAQGRPMEVVRPAATPTEAELQDARYLVTDLSVRAQPAVHLQGEALAA